MKKYIFYAFALIGIMTSCASSKVLNNYATTTDNIFNLKEGMTLNEVTTTLNAEPKDVYSNTVNQTKIVVYKYRLSYQEVPLKAKNNQEYLRGGKAVYKDESNIYIIFDAKTNKMVYYITDSGRKSGKKEINEALKFKLFK
jgi:hypothetical protein